MFREATIADREVFLDLWSLMYEEIEYLGGEHSPTLDTLRDVRRLFDAYVEGSRRGCALLYHPPGEEPQGVAFGGEGWGKSAIRGTHLGHICHGWGIYIAPAHRSRKLSTMIQVAIRKRLSALGFDTVLGDVLVKNGPGLGSVGAIEGWEPYATIFKYDLRRERETEHDPNE